MKKLMKICAAVSVLGLTLLPIASHAAPAGEVDFGQFTLGSGRSELVEIRISRNLIKLACRFIEKKEPEVAKLLSGIEDVRVNVVGIDETNREQLTARVGQIRKKLETGGWDRVVNVAKNAENVGIYLKTGENETVQGLTVLVIQGEKEAVFVNIVGDIKPDQIAMLGDRLNIEPLQSVGKAVGPSKEE
jgi:hypothetical protein